jgi:hypothetical protein
VPPISTVVAVTAIAAVVVVSIVVVVPMVLIVVILVVVAAIVVLGAWAAFEQERVRAIVGARLTRFAYLDRWAWPGWRGSLAWSAYPDLDMDSLTWPALPEGLA